MQRRNVTFVTKIPLTSVKDKKFIGGGVNGGNIYMCVRRRRDYRGALVAAGIVTARLSLYQTHDDDTMSKAGHKLY